MSPAREVCEDCAEVRVGDLVERVGSKEIVAVDRKTGPHSTETTFHYTGRPDPKMEGRRGKVVAVVPASLDAPDRIAVDWQDPKHELASHWKHSAVVAVWVDQPAGTAATRELRKVG